MSCEHECNTTAAFPAEPRNRPGLKHFAYRIGDYASIREHLLSQLVKAPLLTGWTHLDSDEPGIALLECTALLGDILTFYQELYANETKLGTAAWEESVFDLIRLTGYRPAPGLGGATTFALDVESPTVLPKMFAFQAELEGFDQPLIFENSAPVEALPAFGNFHLYRRRRGLQPIQGATSLDITKLGTQTDLLSRQEHGIETGDRILLMSSSTATHEIVVVNSTEVHLDRVTLHLEGRVQQAHPATVTAYKLGRTFRHFGAALAQDYSTFNDNPPKTIVHKTTFTRPVGTNTNPGQHYSVLSDTEIPLDSEVDELSTGARLVCVGQLTNPNSRQFVFVRNVNRIEQRDILWGNVTSPSSVLTLNFPLYNSTFFPIDVLKQNAAANINTDVNAILEENHAPGLSTNPLTDLAAQQTAGLSLEQILHKAEAVGLVANPGAGAQDIRRLRIYETVGETMLLRAPPKQVQSVSDGKVHYFGTHREALALAGRSLLLKNNDGSTQDITVADEQPELVTQSTAGDDTRMWPIQLGVVPTAGPAGFSEQNPAVVVYGNLVAATQGESQSEVPIGSGDGHQVFQTFVLPKAPLTFLADPVQSPPYSAELEIRVDDRLWQRVDSFFNLPADAQVYVVRQFDGNDYVQFGDGENGAKLTSGKDNVTATFRAGIGARGNLVEDTEPTAKRNLKSINRISMPGPAVGGADPEPMSGARVAAPGRMQSLGRLVGLSDYETEALAIPGVLKAGAVFSTQAEQSLIEITVLTDDESATAVHSVEAALRYADQCRGSRRHAIQVVGGSRRYVQLALSLGYDPAYRQSDLNSAVAAALGVLPRLDTEAPKGALFSLDARAFAQDVHISQVVAKAQSVDGVIWVQPVSFSKLGTDSEDPAEIAVPAHPELIPRISATNTEVLALSAWHLSLSATTVITDEECPL